MKGKCVWHEGVGQHCMWFQQVPLLFVAELTLPDEGSTAYFNSSSPVFASKSKALVS